MEKIYIFKIENGKKIPVYGDDAQTIPEVFESVRDAEIWIIENKQHGEEYIISKQNQ